MKVVFVSAPYGSASQAEREAITRAVEAASILLWENGIATICPHLNSGHFADHRTTDPAVYRKGYTELASRSDGLLIMFPRTTAKGQQAEVEAIRDENKPVFKDIKAVLKWGKS